MQTVVMLNVIMLNVIVLNVVELNVVVLIVVMQTVIMLSVVAPLFSVFHLFLYLNHKNKPFTGAPQNMV